MCPNSSSSSRLLKLSMYKQGQAMPRLHQAMVDIRHRQGTFSRRDRQMRKEGSPAHLELASPNPDQDLLTLPCTCVLYQREFPALPETNSHT
jgi:hypothetical protein